MVDNDSDTVTPIDTATNTPGTPIAVGTSPTGIAITPDGTTAYVSNAGADTVSPIDTATNTAGTPIPVGNSPLRHLDHPRPGTRRLVHRDCSTRWFGDLL